MSSTLPCQRLLQINTRLNLAFRLYHERKKKSKLSSIYTYLLKLEVNRTQGSKLAPIRRIRRSSTILQLNFSECRVLLYVSLPTLVTSACGFALSPSDYAPVLLKKHIYVICTYSLQMM